MKLKAFNARDVYGYLNFDISFHSDLSFLVGVNGSGKTTVLRLIQALLTPSLKDLLLIPFSEAAVEFEEKKSAVEIRCKKDEKKVVLAVSGISESLRLPQIDEDELEFLIAREGMRGDFLEDYQIKNANHDVFQYISKINAPVFLGLERTYRASGDSEESIHFERERIIASRARPGMRGKRIVQGSLAAGLTETQVLVREAYRRLRRVEDRHSEKLRESMLLSAFRYYEFSVPSGGNESALPDWMEQKQMLERKTELETALKNIGLSGDRVTKELEEFFGRLDELYSSMSSVEDPKSFPIEWLINKAQIDRVSDLIMIIDDHRSSVSKLYASINTFLASVNTFYKDTNKALQIDTVGQLSVLRPDNQAAPVEALSSGERQLLIIFAHLLFNEFGNRSNVFIIDEPELSLHLRWQEQFVSKAVEVSPETQLILATHSPEILGGYDEKSIAV